MRKYEIKTIFSAVDKMSKTVGKMQGGIGRFVAKTSMSMRKLDNIVTGSIVGLAKFGKAAVLYGGMAAAGIGYALTKLMSAFSVVEDAEAAFTPLMGGAEKARELVAALNKTAASTPFQFENLAEVTQTLLPVMNGDIGKTIKTLRMLGDTAGGNAEKMKGIALGYTKAFLKGKVDMESLNIIGEKGVPIIKELGEVMGLSGDKLFKAISAGKVKLGSLQQAFVNMTEKGGIFYNGMDIASKTLTGKISTLKDNIALTAGVIGGALAPTLKDLVDYFNSLAPIVQKWVEANKGIIQAKFAEYVKKIGDAIKWVVKNFDTIVSVTKNIAILVGIIKVLNIALGLTNLTMLKIAQFRGASTIAELGKVGAAADGAAGKANGLLNAIGGLAVAAGVGWTVGTLIHENIVAPIMKAREELERTRQDLADTMGRDLSKRSAEQLTVDVKNASTVVEAERRATASANSLSTSMGFSASPIFGGGSVSRIEDDKRRLENALAVKRQEQNIQRYQDNTSYLAPADWEMSPITNRSEGQSDSMEITIKDETGRARVTRSPKGGAPRLVHTGAM